ncbi:MAG: transcription-repair coupling factor [Bacteroidales bacterium]|nr:transcription-repair coupling factor [Bacteroidales bacterium]
METKKQALFFTSDIYNFFEEENVFFLPLSGGERSKESLKGVSEKVQRTSALTAIESFFSKTACDDLPKVLDACRSVDIGDNLRDRKAGKDQTIVVCYLDSLHEKVLRKKTTRDSVISLSTGQRIGYSFLKEVLQGIGFTKADFVTRPGEFALRGSIIDIFSFADNLPYRVDFFGDEVESISHFEVDSQRSTDSLQQVEICPDLYSNFEEKDYVGIEEVLPSKAIVWTENDFVEQQLGTAGYEKRLQPVEVKTLPQPVFNKNFEILVHDIAEKQEKGYKVNLLSINPNQIFRMQQVLREFSSSQAVIPPAFIDISLHEGYVDCVSKNCYYTDHQIFERYHKIKVRREVAPAERLTINDLMSFNIGDYVVHIDHGIGQFGGLVKTIIGDKVQEAVKLIYRDGDVIFVSIHGIHRISKYKSADGTPAKVNKLGTKTWETLKHKTKSKLKDIAADLIKLYSERMSSRGFAYSPDNYLQQELEASFMYEDTADQQKATVAVKQDMESPHPMDRLICGDVGFGKTEIAVRASFKAVCDNKQVALLVPTTILAFQHYQTFSGRLRDFPCNVEYLSRQKTAQQVKEIGEKLAAGKIDILIGTHRILNKNLHFKDLGLLIIDEEQKFGVSAKEKLRSLRSNVDTLTLSATPIPRTLQFSLLGSRDLSIINTPPPNRIPISTELIDFNEDTIRDIIMAEVERGGQVFFLHNKVEDILSVEDIIRRICPGVRTCVGHGQMDGEALEKTLLDFIDGDYDVLVCTTIIENGIDIPNANTILINQAQNFGLSDLHQLRGRVGRSNRKAYCYLIVPPMTSISDDARRRLRAIETFSDLGSGFNIAMQDLDIRGAGNLLGAEQSGFIAEMGFETYQKILQEALVEARTEAGVYEEYERALEKATAADTSHKKKHQVRTEFIYDCHIDTDIQALIPDTYINIPSEKIRLYKALDSMKTEEELKGFKEEMEDRYGPIPSQTSELMDIIRLRSLAIALGFEKIVLKKGIMLAYFVSNQLSAYYKSDVFESILRYIQLPGRKYSLTEKDNKLYIKSSPVKTISEAVSLLQGISDNI